MYAAQRTKELVLSKHIGVVKTVIDPDEYVPSLKPFIISAICNESLHFGFQNLTDLLLNG